MNNNKRNLRVRRRLNARRRRRMTINTIKFILSTLIVIALIFIAHGFISNAKNDDLKIVNVTTEEIKNASYTNPTATEIPLSKDASYVNIEIPISTQAPITTRPKTDLEILEEELGNKKIKLDHEILINYDLPSKYYNDKDFSSFQPYMDYHHITDETSSAYAVTRSDNAYVDEYGMLRYSLKEDQFSIDGKDDFVIALGTFYKSSEKCGERFLIVTSTGMYTATTGDTKDGKHTDQYHMFSSHCKGTKAGLIEWLVDVDKLEDLPKRAGSITYSSHEELQGEILYIYKIQ